MKAKSPLFRKLLVATDFSEHAGAALGRALDLAARLPAELTVVHVLDDVASAVPGTSFEGAWTIRPEELEAAEKRLRKQAAEQLEAWVAPHRRDGLKLKTTVACGVPFVEIIQLVHKNRHDLVLTGTRGHSALQRILVGSTAERLVRKCQVPVWLVQAEHEWPLPSILAPVDLTEVSGKSLRLAETLAGLWGCPLTALYVFNFPKKPVLLPPLATAGLDVHKERYIVRHQAANQLHDFVWKYAQQPEKVVQQLGMGQPWQVIDRTARKLDAGLIVMGSVGRTGLSGFFIGNTAERVLRVCDCSILTIKPDGFVSPVMAEL